MSKPTPSREIALMKEIDHLADRFEAALKTGRAPLIEEYLAQVESSGRARLLGELIKLDVEWQVQNGQTIVPDHYARRFPDDLLTIESALQEWADEGASNLNSRPDIGAQDMPAPVAPNEVFPKRFGRFTLQRCLGSGGFGSVYLADDTRLGRQVAIKIPHSSAAIEHQRRFVTEARAAAKLRHANIVTVHDSDVIDGSWYIVSEFISGSDMSHRMKNRKPTLRQLIAWLRDAARGLAYAHSQGVIHRDVKPSNLLVSENDEVYISDFGLARRGDDQSSLTASGTVLGTPAYMAPEQAAGITSSIGPACDQYSLGVVLFQVLTGRLPFRGNIQQILQKVIREAPPQPRKLNPHVPAALEAICLRALAKNPAHRYPDIQAFADDLDCWLEGKPVSVLAESGWHEVGLQYLRSRPALMLLSAFVLVLPIGVLVALAQLGGGRSVPDPAKDIPRLQLPGARKEARAQAPGLNRRDAMTDGAPAAPKLSRERQRKLLVEATAPGQSWKLPIPDAENAKGLDGHFISSDGEARVFLLQHPDDEGRRSLWTGQLVEQANSNTGNGQLDLHPVLDLQYQSGDLALAGDLRRLRFGIDRNGLLAQQTSKELLPLQKLTKANAHLAVNRHNSQLRELTAPGQVFEGTLQFPGEESRRVELTFTEFRDDGGYVRAVLQSSEFPFIMAPFVGTCDTSPAALVNGKSIRLVRKSAAMGEATGWGVFASPWQSPELHLSQGKQGELVGVADRGQLKLRVAKTITPFAHRKEQWSKAIFPGAVWKGVLRYRDTPPTRVIVTVAETRDDLRYVRLLAEDEANPHRYCVYEGAVDTSDDTIDGFALSLHRKSASPASVGEGERTRLGLFGYALEYPHAARLATDGKSLLCRTAAGEELTLTQAPAPAVRPYEQAVAAALWRTVCTPAQEWEGTLRNTQFGQNTSIRLQFLAEPDALGRIVVRISVPSQPRIRIAYAGTLNVDGDVQPNAFALRLTKQGAGQGNSAVFGKGIDSRIHFRLSTDGMKLVGMAGPPEWIEFMEMSKVIEAPKSGKKTKGEPNSP